MYLRVLRPWGVLAVLIGSATPVAAELIAADSFLVGEEGVGAIPELGEYFVPSEGTRLRDQNPFVEPGWTEGNAWNVGTAQMVADTFTLSVPAVDYATGGKAKYEAAVPAAFRAGNRRLDSYQESDTYYMSVLLNPGAGFAGQFFDGASHAMVGFTNPISEAAFENQEGADNVFGLLFGFQGQNGGPGTADDSANLILRARAPETGQLEDTVLVEGIASDTFLILAKLQVNVDDGIADRVDYWVNPTELGTEQLLTQSAQASGSVETWAMDTADRMTHTQVVVNNWIRNFFWDELRFGTVLSSVTGVDSPALLCDLNVDGGVDAADAGILFGNWGQSGTGDVNTDSIVDAADAGVCFAEWTGDSATRPVPEPQFWATFVGLTCSLALVGKTHSSVRASIAMT